MTFEECKKIKDMSKRLIAFIQCQGAPFESKQKKIIKEISLLMQYCQTCVIENNVSVLGGGNLANDN